VTVPAAQLHGAADWGQQPELPPALLVLGEADVAAAFVWQTPSLVMVLGVPGEGSRRIELCIGLLRFFRLDFLATRPQPSNSTPTVTSQN
jgi:hypothetical protein